MKRTKRLFILLGLLAALCLVTLFVTKMEEKKEQIKNTDEVILSVDPETVKKLSWDYDDVSLSFHKDDAWHWDDDAAFPVDAEKMKKLLSTFEEFGAAFIIEDVEDFSQYGLEDPTCTIQFETDEEKYEIVLGAYSTMDSQRYVSIGDGNVYLVSVDPFSSFEITLKDTILDDDTPTIKEANKITFSGAEDYVISYEEDSAATYCADDLYFTEQKGKKVPLSTTSVEDYLSGISYLGLDEYVSYHVTDEELKAWGLDTPELTIQVDYTVTDEDDNQSDESITLHIGRNQEELAAKKEAEEKEEDYTDPITAYARVGNSQIVYQISEEDYNLLAAATYEDLRHKEVLTADMDRVIGLDVSLDEVAYSITNVVAADSKPVSAEENSEEIASEAEAEEAVQDEAVQVEAVQDEDEEIEEKDSSDQESADSSEENTKEDGPTYYYKNEEVDLSDVKTKLSALTITEFTQDTPSEVEELGLLVFLDNANYKQVDIKMYRYDGSSCLVTVNGETIGLVDRSAVVSLKEAINAIVLG